MTTHPVLGVRRLLSGFGLLELLILLSPITDMLVGIGKHNDMAALSMAGPLHKILLLLLIPYAIVKTKSLVSWQRGVLFAVVVAMWLHLVHLLMSYDSPGLVENLNQTVRFWFFPLVIIGLVLMYDRGVTHDKMYRLITILALLYSTLLLLPTYMGINNAAYEVWLNKEGSAGLFYEANEIGIICGALGAYLVIYSVLRRFSLPILAVAGVTILAGFTTGTKAPLAFLALSFAYVAFVYIKDRKRRARLNKWVVVPIVLLAIVASQGVIANIMSSYERQIIRNGGGLEDLVLNGRDDLLGVNLGKFNSEFSLGDQLFGRNSLDLHSGTKVKETEMDFADILFNFGIVGFILYVLSMIVILRKVFGRRDHGEYTIERAVLVMGLIAALIMGHTLSSPSVALVFALFAVIAMKAHRKSKVLSYES